MRNGMCRKMFESGAALQPIVKGKCKKCQKVYSLRWCRSVESLFQSPVLFDDRHQCCSVCLTFRRYYVLLFNLLVTSLMNEREVHVIVLHFLCSTLPTFVFFEGSNALHVTAHFARPRGILVVAAVQTLSPCHKSHISNTCESSLV